MLNQLTYDKLVKMRMSAMADAYRQQTEDSAVANLSFDERFVIAVDVEYWSRHNNRRKRNIHQAALISPTRHWPTIITLQVVCWTGHLLKF